MIYFLQGELTRRIKIGFTIRLIQSRIAAQKTGSPDKLIFVGAHPGDKRTEDELHFKFDAYRSHGEWFDEAPALTHYIETRCFHDIDIAHNADSLVSYDGDSYEFLLTLSHEEIHDRYMAYLVKKLDQRDARKRPSAKPSSRKN